MQPYFLIYSLLINFLRMKKLYLLLIVILICYTGFSQPGVNCVSPYVVASLPYTGTAFTTNGFGNDYTSPCPLCQATNYMSGSDFVFRFQPAYDMNISVRLSATTSPAGTVGLFLVNGCPDDVLTQCLVKVEGNQPGTSYPEMLNIQVDSDTVYYIIIDTYNIFNMNPYTGFNIEIFEAHNTDIKAMKIFEPVTSCELNSERFVILFKNIGSDTLYSVPVGYQVDGNPPVMESRDEIALPGNEYYYTFSTYYDLSVPDKTYMVKMFSALPQDGNKLNDTLYFPVTNNNTITNYPYFHDFESNTDGWSTEWINHLEPGTSWQWGVPVKPVINSAASGTKCWVTDTAGTNQVNENSYVISPCFDFTNVTLPVFEFDIWYETLPVDFIQLEFTTVDSVGQHVSWNVIGQYGSGQNWYNYNNQQNSGWNGSSGGWIHALHPLDTLGGKPFVKLRVTFRGGLNGQGEGFAFDNVKISESPMNDLAVENILIPQSKCGLSATDTVKIRIKNHGMNQQSGFVVKCSVDGGSNFVTETVTDTIDFGQTITYSFQNSFNMSAPGVYNIITFTELPADNNQSNDTSFTQVMNYPTVSQFPHKADFEENNGYWFPGGISPSWEWGEPADSILTSSASGLKCWATNLSGYHNLGERSYVTSPCFDLTGMLNPLLKINIWYDELYPSYCQFKVSVNGGATYQALGSAADNNWYNAGYSWTYNSFGWKQVKHTLKNYTAYNDISFQFYFEGGVQKSGFAFDDFTICDAPLAGFEQVFPVKNYVVDVINLSQNYDSCRWDFGDGTYSNVCNPSHVYPSQDSVLVKLIVYNSCGSDSISLWVYPQWMGIEEISGSLSLTFCPNPVKDILLIGSDSGEKRVNLTITDLKGRAVLETTLSFNNKEKAALNLNSLPGGFYMLRATADGFGCYRKIIKLN